MTDRTGIRDAWDWRGHSFHSPASAGVVPTLNYWGALSHLVVKVQGDWTSIASLGALTRIKLTYSQRLSESWNDFTSFCHTHTYICMHKIFRLLLFLFMEWNEFQILTWFTIWRLSQAQYMDIIYSSQYWYVVMPYWNHTLLDSAVPYHQIYVYEGESALTLPETEKARCVHVTYAVVRGQNPLPHFKWHPGNHSLIPSNNLLGRQWIYYMNDWEYIFLQLFLKQQLLDPSQQVSNISWHWSSHSWWHSGTWWGIDWST